MPDLSGVEVLRAAKAVNRDIVAFMMTAFASTDTAVEAMRLGAVDYFTKPFNMDELRLKVRQQLETHRLKEENVLLKRALNTRHEFSNIIGRSEAMLGVFRMIETIARTSSTVLITGESGTGKELVARAIHYNSPAPRPSVRRAQLRRGARDAARVGAVRPHARRVHRRRHEQEGAARSRRARHHLPRRDRRDDADDAGEAAARAAGAHASAGSAAPTRCSADIRVVAATNQDLQKAVAEGRFREDLFYRINVIPIHLPPLRERRRTFRCWPSTSWSSTRRRWRSRCAASRRRRSGCWPPTPGPATSASSRTSIERAVALEQTPSVLPESLPAQVLGAVRDAGSTRDSRRLQAVRRAFRRRGPCCQTSAKASTSRPRVRSSTATTWPSPLSGPAASKRRAAELLGMSFRSFRYYVKKLSIK